MTLTPCDHLGQLQFDVVSHTYSLGGGTTLPSVTKILQENRMLPFRNPPGARAQIGTWIHSMLFLYHRGNLNVEKLAPEMREILDVYRRWEEKVGLVVLANNQPLWHPWYYYAGTPDLIGVVREKLCVVDFKWGEERPDIVVQLAGYAELAIHSYKELNGFTVKDLRVVPLYLKKLGNGNGYEEISGKTLADSLSVFLSAHTIYRWRVMNNLASRREISHDESDD